MSPTEHGIRRTELTLENRLEPRPVDMARELKWPFLDLACQRDDKCASPSQIPSPSTSFNSTEVWVGTSMSWTRA